MSVLAVLRTCASCEWVFKMVDDDPECPKCKFGSYGAKYVYGKQAYTYARTQKPWKEKKMFSYEMKLEGEINESLTIYQKTLQPKRWT